MKKKLLTIATLLLATAVIFANLNSPDKKTGTSIGKNADKIETDEWAMGYNSAIRQFAPEEKVTEMTIISVKSPARKEAYTSLKAGEQEEHSPYADGYHKALETLTRENICPRN